MIARLARRFIALFAAYVLALHAALALAAVMPAAGAASKICAGSPENGLPLDQRTSCELHCLAAGAGCAAAGPSHEHDIAFAEARNHLPTAAACVGRLTERAPHIARAPPRA